MANFQKTQSGNPRGRPKGSLNTYPKIIPNKFRWDVSQICIEMGFDPFRKLIEIATEGQYEKNRLEAAKELANYIAPKLRSVELSTEAGKHFNVIIELNQNTKNLVEGHKLVTP